MLRNALLRQMRQLTKQYGTSPEEITPGAVFDGLICRAYEQTGEQVVVVIDEYDAPLLDVLHEDEQLSGFRRVMHIQEWMQYIILGLTVLVQWKLNLEKIHLMHPEES